MSYFEEPDSYIKSKIKFEYDLPSYASKFEAEKATSVVTSKLVKKADLASIKSEVDELDVDKLKPLPNDLSKLSYVVKNDFFEKTVYDELIEQVNAFDSIVSKLVKKSYDTKIKEIF